MTETAADDLPPGEALPPETPPEKSKAGRFFKVLGLTAVLAGAAAAAGWFWLRHTVYEVPVPREDPETAVTIAVEEGDTMPRIIRRLQDAGIDVNPYVMRAAARMTEHRSHLIHTGRYIFLPGLTPAGILDTLSKGAIADCQLRIPDGAPVWEIRAIFAAQGDMKHRTDSLTEAELADKLGLPSDRLEGWFAPETYLFTPGTSDIAIMRQAVERQKALLQAAWEARSPDAQVKTPYEALILASIIEKETGLPEDRFRVSSVFNNRLRLGMPLQTDPTVIYGLGPSFTGTLKKKDLTTPTPYNTYTMTGLPPTPIASPPPASIEAALHPEETQYLYFVSRGDGSSQFSKSLKEHNRAVRQFILKKNTRPAVKTGSTAVPAAQTAAPVPAATAPAVPAQPVTAPAAPSVPTPADSVSLTPAAQALPAASAQPQ